MLSVPQDSCFLLGSWPSQAWAGGCLRLLYSVGSEEVTDFESGAFAS